jgi:Na+-driven multidrug efflux pump
LIGAALTLGLTNFFLDYIFIFGKLGLPAMGIQGAALGSVIAEIVTFLYMTIYALRQVDFQKYGLFRLPRLNRKLTSGLLMISWPVALQALTEAGRWFAFFLIMEKVSTDVLAFSNIFYCCLGIFLIASEAFAEATCSYVSNLIGAGRADQIAAFVRHLVSRCWLVSLPFVLPALIFPEEILRIFMSDEVLIEGSVGGLRLIAVAALVMIPGQMWSAAVLGTGDTLAALVVEIILTAVMLAGAYFAALTFDLSLAWIWMSVPIGWVACHVASYAWIKSRRWERLEV